MALDPLKQLEENPWLIAVVLAGAGIAMVVFIFVWVKCVRSSSLGPHASIVRIALTARAHVERRETKEAARLYREALARLYGRAAAPSPSPSPPSAGADGAGGVNGASGEAAAEKEEGEDVKPSAPAAEDAAILAAQELDRVLQDYNGFAGAHAVLALGLRLKSGFCWDAALVPADAVGTGADAPPVVAPAPPPGTTTMVTGAAFGEGPSPDVRATSSTPRSSLREAALPSVPEDAVGEAAAAQSNIFVCCTCSSRSRVENKNGKYFRCHSCQATVVPWHVLTTSSSPESPSTGSSSGAGADDASADLPKGGLRGASAARSLCCRSRRVRPQRSLEHLRDICWEDTDFSSLLKHPTGCGQSRDVPEDCRHHVQIGPTCGLAAVNNLITNAGKDAVDREHMFAISTRLGDVEASLRGGERSVEEAGEQRTVSELYTASEGGHFDVQTLQIALEEAGFQMWYMSANRILSAKRLFEAPAGGSRWQRRRSARSTAQASGGGGGGADGPLPIGYIVHWRDQFNCRSDHWFVVRQHGKGLILLQDSLHDSVFELTEVETHRLLAALPPGALFAVSRNPDGALASGGDSTMAAPVPEESAADAEASAEAP